MNLGGDVGELVLAGAGVAQAVERESLADVGVGEGRQKFLDQHVEGVVEALGRILIGCGHREVIQERECREIHLLE